MVNTVEVSTAVQAVRGMLSFFLAIGLWRFLEYIEKIWGKKTAMWFAVIISCSAFLLLEEFPRPTP